MNCLNLLINTQKRSLRGAAEARSTSGGKKTRDY
jgi:hypothetical protein